MKFSGRLGAYGLADLVSVLEQLQFQGTLRLKRGAEQALIVFDADRIFFPLPYREAPRGRKRRTTGRIRLRAERTLKRVCGWTRVEFDTHPNRLPPPTPGEFRVTGKALARFCEVPSRRRQLTFSGRLSGALLRALGSALVGVRSTGVLLVDDGRAATSVFYHSGTPFRRSSARRLRLTKGQVVVRYGSGARCELVEHPERFQQIRQGWAA